jgi:hypothetical protein
MLQLTRMIAGLLADAFRLLFLLLQTSAAIRHHPTDPARSIFAYSTSAVIASLD